MHREACLFGPDPDSWRPERWLCIESKRQEMNNALLTVCFSAFLLLLHSQEV
jgi:hypothetical protein